MATGNVHIVGRNQGARKAGDPYNISKVRVITLGKAYFKQPRNNGLTFVSLREFMCMRLPFISYLKPGT